MKEDPFSNKLASKIKSQPAAAALANEYASDDSASTDEGIPINKDTCSRMTHLFQIKDGQAKHFEIDSRVGLNGSKTCWSFPCVYDQQN